MQIVGSICRAALVAFQNVAEDGGAELRKQSTKMRKPLARGRWLLAGKRVGNKWSATCLGSVELSKRHVCREAKVVAGPNPVDG